MYGRPMTRHRPTRGRVGIVRLAVVGALVVVGSTACGDDLPGGTAELSIHFRQLPNGGLGAVGTHGLHICQSDTGIDRIHVTVDSIPADNTTQAHEFFWTCEDLSQD